MVELDGNGWDQFLSNYPDAHLLQTSAWGELKASFGWKVIRISDSSTGDPAKAIGAQILLRNLPLDFSMAYIPKGPVGEDWQILLPELDRICQKARAILLKIEPDRWLPTTKQTDTTKANRPPAGFQLSAHSIQPPRTLLIDLGENEDTILGNMKQKTRYNIKLAQKKGVVIHSSADLDGFYRLIKVTGQRDQFGVHSLGYYRRAYELFHSRGDCELLLAEYQGEMLAGLMVFAHGKRAWYLYGASAADHRDRMPTYLLQWEAMRWARAHGCTEYDLWGVPDEKEEILESYFTQRNEGLWGVYRFKRGFGGRLARAAGPYDRVYQPLLYKMYLAWSRFRGSD